MPECISYFSCNEKNISLDQIIRLLIAVDANGCPVFRTTNTGSSGTVSFSSTVRTPSRTENAVVGSYTVATGARSVTIETSSDFVGTILGATAQANGFYNFAVQQNDDTLGAIAYVITSGSVIINKIV